MAVVGVTTLKSFTMQNYELFSRELLMLPGTLFVENNEHRFGVVDIFHKAVEVV
jgi:hypothetical protein